MPPVDFEHLGDAWGAIIDGWSGRASPIQDPPLATDHWEWVDGLAPYAVSVAGDVVTLTVQNDAAGQIELRAPKPEDSMAGILDLNANPNYRRCPFFWKEDPEAIVPWGAATYRGPLLAAVFTSPPFMGAQTIFVSVPSTTFYPGLTCNLYVRVRSELASEYGPNRYTGSFACDWEPGTAQFSGLDMSHQPGPEAAASWFQFPAALATEIAGDDILAINTLAEALASSGGPAGTASTQRGKAIVASSSYEDVLPKMTGTSDNAMRRLARGVQIAFGGELTVRTKNPDAVVAMRRGVMVRNG